jgi:hypothetical protein
VPGPERGGKGALQAAAAAQRAAAHARVAAAALAAAVVPALNKRPLRTAWDSGAQEQSRVDEQSHNQPTEIAELVAAAQKIMDSFKRSQSRRRMAAAAVQGAAPRPTLVSHAPVERRTLNRRRPMQRRGPAASPTLIAVAPPSAKPELRPRGSSEAPSRAHK